MSADMILEYFAVHNDYDKIQFQLALQCAPVIKGIKASNLYSLERKDIPMLSSILSTLNLEYIFIGKGNKILAFIYQKERLGKYLSRNDVIRFLKKYGYKNSDFDQLLLRLVMRIKEFQNKENGFPHELGIFLEYPVRDVEGFIYNNGRNFLHTGYWKVYSDVEIAKNRFKSYDKARDELLGYLLEGQRLNDIVDKISWKQQFTRNRRITAYAFHI